MKLYEYQGKVLFRRFGIPVPRSIIAHSPEDVIIGSEKTGLPCVLKVQIQSGGRGKAGGIKVADSVVEALELARNLLGSVVTDEKVQTLLVEEKIDIAHELYAGIVVDRLAGQPLLLLSAEGGIDIEVLAERSPEKITRQYLDPLKGLRRYQAVEIAKSVGLSGKVMASVADCLFNLYELFAQCDAEIAEINPLVITTKGEVIASDSKVLINDDSLVRQQQILELIDDQEVLNAVLGEARSKGYSFVDLDGDVALIGGGAGLTLLLMDLIAMNGGKAANFADIMGGITRERVKELMLLILDKAAEEHRIRSAVVVCSLTGTPVDSFVGGIVDAIREKVSLVPVTASIHAVDAAVDKMSLKDAILLLQDAGVSNYDSIQEAVASAVAASKGGF